MNSELLTKDAGEELDIAIAKLLGLKVNTTEEHGHAVFSWDREWLDVWLETDDNGSIPVPSYSTDLNAAWKLIETMRAFRLVGDGDDSEAAIFPLGILPIYGDAPRDKPALAVCRAWIQWKQQEGGAK